MLEEQRYAGQDAIFRVEDVSKLVVGDIWRATPSAYGVASAADVGARTPGPRC